VILYDVKRGSPADLAGLHGLKMGPRGSVDIGDVIIAVDGNPVVTYDDLYQVLDPHAAGETVRVTISREGRTADVDLKLIEIDD
jgi:S1-C subfamily serine protease